MDKILLILDLDETLIYASEDSDGFTPDFKVCGYNVVKRPYLEEFLINCSVNFRIAIWSSASDDYVQEVVNRIMPDSVKPEFIWGRSKATYRPTTGSVQYEYPELNHYHYIKRLKKVKRLGFRLERTLMVDDSEHKLCENYGNAIYVIEFRGEADDTELLILQEYLKGLINCGNVRDVEKRNWRDQILK